MTTFWISLTLIARLGVGATFIFAGWTKLHTERSEFLKAVLAYELLPPLLARILASGLPPIEVIIGFMLLLGFILPLASIVGALLLLMMTGAVVAAIVRGKDISCGCFGLKGKIKPVRWTIVIRNTVLTLVLVIFYFEGPSSLSLDKAFNSLGINTYWSIGMGVAITICAFILLYRRNPVKQVSLAPQKGGN